MNKQAKPSLRAKNAVERGMNLVFLLCGFIAIAFVVLITIYLIISGLPAIKEVGLIDFLFGTRWASTDKTNPAYGILPFILTSIYGTAGAIIIGVPIGFLTAVFLAKVAPPKVAAVIRPAVDLLAGIPSVVYGLVGMMVLLPAIREFFNIPAGDSLLAAIIVLAVMILPSIISVSETALKAVPKEYEEASPGPGSHRAGDLLPGYRARCQERHRRGGGAGRGPCHWRGHGYPDGGRQCGQHALHALQRQIPHYGHRPAR